MPQKKIFQNNISYLACAEIATICRPLTEHLGIDYFGILFEFVNWNTKQVENVYLCNSHQHMDIFYDRYQKKGPYKIDIISNLANYQINQNKYLLDSPEVAAFAHKVYGAHNSLRKLEKINDNEWIRLVFATKSDDPKYLNLYLNNRDLLDRFVLHFKDKAASIINKAKSNKVLFEDITIDKNDNALVNCLGTTSLSDKRDDFLKSIVATHYPITNKLGEIIKIPQGEMLCLKLLARGRNIKEIANSLGISPRTVETNIANSKKRLECFSRKELLDLLELNNIWSIS